MCRHQSSVKMMLSAVDNFQSLIGYCLTCILTVRIFQIHLCEEFWGFQKEWVPSNPLTFTVRKPAFWEFWPETYMYTWGLSPMTNWTPSCDYFRHDGDLRVVKWTWLLNLKSLLPWPLKNTFYNYFILLGRLHGSKFLGHSSKWLLSVDNSVSLSTGWTVLGILQLPGQTWWLIRTQWHSSFQGWN